MKTCAHFQNNIPALFDQSVSESERIALEKHMSACSDCSALYHEYRKTLDVAGSYERPAALFDNEDAFLDRLDSAIDTETVVSPLPTHTTRSNIISYRKYFYRPIGIAAASVAALVVGLFIGHELFSPDSIQHVNTENPNADISIAENASLSATDQAETYIDRATLILLSIVNTDIEEEMPYRPSFARQRELSRTLLDESMHIREGLATATPDHDRLLGLMDNLEVILMQIAALDTDYTADDLAFIQSSAERKAVLFKMNLDAIMTADRPMTAADTHSDIIQPVHFQSDTIY